MCNVILIDDDKNQLFLNTILLTEANIFNSILTFHHPVEALDHLKENLNPSRDIIVLDINMPQMTAWEFLNKMKTEFKSEIELKLNLFIASHSLNPNVIQKANEHVLVKKFIDKFMLVDEITSYAKARMFGQQRLAS